MRKCCKPECEKLAEYEIWHGAAPDQYTDSCLEHIPDMLTDALEHKLYLIEGARGPVEGAVTVSIKQ